ncbi:hypothetical protein PVAND_014951 [Polypedilum vanderplanki]|uniref:C2H2-type domain-containing protein n=1 Tax=Polypedilum vanderplanki TaxID=319348 RepID=A0A9J6BB75_POLVA|nr:hypothetical protein PVAND_014951 [Polypedilum vanderplanki]
MNFSFGTFPTIHHQFATSSTSSTPSTQENRYANYQAPSTATATPVKFRAEDMAMTSSNINKYVTHYPTSSTHLQYGYNTTQQTENPKTSYTVHTTSAVSHTAAPSELSQDITSLLLQKDQSSDSTTKRVLQSSSVADYLSHLPSLHHFLKYSDAIKKESVTSQPTVSAPQTLNLIPSTSSIANIIQPIQQSQTTLQIPVQAPATATAPATTNTKKKKKKKAPKEKKTKPKAGEIRLKFALDGSILFVCPECQLALPEKEILDQHMVGHSNLERRFVCEICNAALKRKDHLTRHRQSHNADRPYLCGHCLKAFKRKEQLHLHSVIHTGNKKHTCVECNKGFYRKDHLRKHTRSHIARRLKAELATQQQQQTTNQNTTDQQQQQQNEAQQPQIMQIQHQQNCQ